MTWHKKLILAVDTNADALTRAILFASNHEVGCKFIIVKLYDKKSN
jgi:hypothetical protein